MYKGIYRCRLCGKTFVEGSTDSEDIAMGNLYHMIYGQKLKTDDGIPFSKQTIHRNMDNGCVGLADFQGFEYEDDENGRKI